MAKPNDAGGRWAYVLTLVVMLVSANVAFGKQAPTLLVLGDSLSAGYGIPVEQGWVRLLGRRLDAEGYPHRVVNASISGDTTRGGRARLGPVLDEQAPSVVLLALGGNDGLRGVSPMETRRNLEAMIVAAQESGANVLLLGIRLPPNYGMAYTRAFEGVFVALAEEYDVPLLPFLLEGVATMPGMMQSDGLHPTADAQPRMLENVWPLLTPLLERTAAYAELGDRE